MVTIHIIVGSSRPNRFGIKVARWVHGLARQHTDAKFELIDLKELNLPFLDEPETPSSGNYTQERTKKWARTVARADAYIWVHPEYNHSVSPVLKNALDFLWREWNDKPVALVGYGAEAGGARAAEQLRLIAGALKMFDLRTQVMIPNYWQFVNAEGKFEPSPEHIKKANRVLEELVFWARHMQTARHELQSGA